MTEFQSELESLRASVGRLALDEVELCNCFHARLTTEEKNEWERFSASTAEYAHFRDCGSRVSWQLRHGTEDGYVSACREYDKALNVMFAVAEKWSRGLASRRGW